MKPQINGTTGTTDPKDTGSTTEEPFNSQKFRDWNKAEQMKGRRIRNFDRALLIVARLNFEGCLDTHRERDFFDFHHENAVKAVLDMLERFELDSPKGEIVDVFSQWGKDDK